jgi:hypothetical protein
MEGKFIMLGPIMTGIVHCVLGGIAGVIVVIIYVSIAGVREKRPPTPRS